MKRNKNKYIKEFVDYCLQSGYSEGLFLNERNVDEYVETSVDAYNGYPLFLDVFNGGYDAKTYTRMLRVDFKSRLGKTLGIATDNYESVLLFEPPEVPKTGMIQYLKAADMSSIPLFFKPATVRLDSFEKYALKKRKAYLDDKTWYIYIFTTKKAYQRQGYGRKLMNLLLSFAKERGYRLCLETNLAANIKLYESFGFNLMDSSFYKRRLEHYVMLYGNR